MEQSIPSQATVPGSMAQIFITMKYTLLDYIRSRRFFILLIITLIVGILLTVVVGYYHPPGFFPAQVAPNMPVSLPFYGQWWGQTATFIVMLSGIFFGGDAISGEFQNKTGYFSVPNPIRRSSIYIGKWLSAFIASSVILGIFTIITVGNGLAYFGTAGFPLEFAESVLFSWFYLAAVLGFTFFFSSLFKTNSMSILITTILFLFVFNILQVLVAGFAQVEPWFILTYGAGIIGNILTFPYPARTTLIPLGNSPDAPTLTTYNVPIPEGLAIIAVYFLVTAILGLLLFERKEFT